LRAVQVPWRRNAERPKVLADTMGPVVEFMLRVIGAMVRAA
jgi:hypothetical protein